MEKLIRRILSGMISDRIPFEHVFSIYSPLNDMIGTRELILLFDEIERVFNIPPLPYYMENFHHFEMNTQQLIGMVNPLKPHKIKLEDIQANRQLLSKLFDKKRPLILYHEMFSNTELVDVEENRLTMDRLTIDIPSKLIAYQLMWYPKSNAVSMLTSITEDSGEGIYDGIIYKIKQ